MGVPMSQLPCQPALFCLAQSLLTGQAQRAPSSILAAMVAKGFPLVGPTSTPAPVLACPQATRSLPHVTAEMILLPLALPLPGVRAGGGAVSQWCWGCRILGQDLGRPERPGQG